MRDWQRRSKKEVEEAARRACGNAPLMKKRALLGFSAGGWEAYKLGTGDCKETSEYSLMVGIGVEELSPSQVNRDHTVRGGCPNLRIYREHDFPKQFSDSLQQMIADSIPSAAPRTRFAGLRPTTTTTAD
jgi:hypothetical protein